MGLDIKTLEGSVQTTDATKTPILDVVLPPLSGIKIDFGVMAIGNSTANTLGQTIVMWVTNLGGSITQTGSPVSTTWPNGGVAGWSVTADAVTESGVDILRFSGTGEAGKVIDWFSNATVTIFRKP